MDGEGGGRVMLPRVLRISYPYLNQRGQIMPTNYYVPPQIFIPSSIPEYAGL